MAVLRFPNPVSDVPKFVDVFRLLRTHLAEPNFSHDDIVRVLVAEGQASSCGTVGEEALERSTRDDRSRDPLYNQAKMYSELFRMLGWMHPGTDSGHFIFSGLAPYIANETLTSPLIRENLYSIVMPNPHVENRGGHILRPFATILQLMRQLNGLMSRDEMIVAALTLADDTTVNALADRVGVIRSARGRAQRLADLLETAADGMQINTAQNYTRFPLGVLRSAGWAVGERVRGIYERSTQMYRLTPTGVQLADKLAGMVDVRHAQLAQFDEDERGAFVLLSQYAAFARGGFDLSAVQNSIPSVEQRCRRIIQQVGTKDFNNILYSPFQQSPPIDLARASAIDEDLPI